MILQTIVVLYTVQYNTIQCCRSNALYSRSRCASSTRQSTTRARRCSRSFHLTQLKNQSTLSPHQRCLLMTTVSGTMANAEQSAALSVGEVQSSQVRPSVDLSSIINLDDFQRKGEPLRINPGNHWYPFRSTTIIPCSAIFPFTTSIVLIQ